MSHEYCSLITRDLEEPLAGTAPNARHIVFITWPKRFWDRDVLLSEGGFPETLGEDQHLWSALVGKVTLRLITDGTVGTDSCEVLIYPEGVRYTVAPAQLTDVLTAHFSGNPSQVAEPITTPQVMVCTHGKHDKCCAKFGGAVVQRLREGVDARQASVKVWESSHLGGHRFAATLAAFPQGRMHGYLTPELADEWLDAFLADQVHAPTYRGRIWLEGLHQVAEAFAQTVCQQEHWSAQPELIEVTEAPEQTQVQVRLHPLSTASSSQPSILELVLHRQKFLGPKGCDGLEAPEARMRWVLQGYSVQTG